MLWTDKFNIFIALVVPPLVVALLGVMGSVSSMAPVIPIDCVVVSYDSNTFINENNFTESKLDEYHSPYLDAVNKSELLNLVHFYNTTTDIYGMESARNY
ncbi:MAG: hypothetical protein ACTSR7_13585 [Promethearchaeota archaeon]